jgi:hypothetical protein
MPRPARLGGAERQRSMHSRGAPTDGDATKRSCQSWKQSVPRWRSCGPVCAPRARREAFAPLRDGKNPAAQSAPSKDLARVHAERAVQPRADGR